MRKKVFGRKLGRNRRSRTALLRSLAKAVIANGEIRTTRAKALAVRPELEKLMGLVKNGSIADRREALSRLANDRDATDVLFSKYADFAKSRTSGFTRLSRLSPRRGDSAEMMLVSWVELPVEKPKLKKGATDTKVKVS